MVELGARVGRAASSSPARPYRAACTDAEHLVDGEMQKRSTASSAEREIVRVPPAAVQCSNRFADRAIGRAGSVALTAIS